MSDKPKKPFLKKGTRQFLSNAQVRSQHDKPKIVDFGAENEEDYAPIKVAPVKNTYDERPITAKRPVDKTVSSRPTKVPASNEQSGRKNVAKDQPDPAKKIEEFKKQFLQEDNEDRIFVSKKKVVENKPPAPTQQYRQTVTKAAERNSYGQEHEPEEQGNLDFYLNKKKRPNAAVEKLIERNAPNREPRFGGKNKYQFEDDPEPAEEQLNFDDEYGGRDEALAEQYPRYSRSLEQNEVDEQEQKPRSKQGSSAKKQKSSSSSQQEEYNFDDEQEWGSQSKRGVMKRSLLKQQLKEERSKLEEDIALEKKRSNKFGSYGMDQDDAPPQTAPRQKSKLVDKFFYGQEAGKATNGRTPSAQLAPSTQLPPSFRKQDSSIPVKITVGDVPDDVKLQIIEEGVTKMKQMLEKEVEHVKAEGDNMRRLKIRYEEEARQLEKDRKELQRESERRKLEFEDYIKEEKAKIAKDKKVIKDGLENRYTRKQKQEFEELRKEIEELKEEKRKAESKLRAEVERQKKLVMEEQAKNKQLEEEIRQLEKCRIRERQLVEAQQPQQPPAKTILKGAPPPPPVCENYNQLNAISDPISSRMLRPTFTLSDLPMDSYRFEANAYYQRYCDYRDQQDPLETEREEPERIKRIYRSGKLEHEYIKKYIKEMFPDGYEIVHFVNGDVKQKLPNGIVVYFSSDKQLVEYTLTPKRVVRTVPTKIYYFVRDAQVEMKTTTAAGAIHEIYNGASITRTYPDNRVEEVHNGTATTTHNNARVVNNGQAEQVTYPRHLRGF